MSIKRKRILLVACIICALFYLYYSNQEIKQIPKVVTIQKRFEANSERDTTKQDAMFNFTSRVFSDIHNLPPLDNPIYLIPETKHPQIIWWDNSIFPHSHPNLQCELGTCTVTKNRKELSNPLTRGLILYGVVYDFNNLPLPRLPHHEWALFMDESPKRGWIFSDDTMISLFNHTATFRRESDYPLTTQYLTDPDEWFEDTYIVNITEKNRLQREDGLAPAVFVHTDCNPPSDRDTYIKELMKYIPIDSYGKCLKNKKIPQDIDGELKLWKTEYFHFLAKYKFQIAFENAVCSDYITEKVLRPLSIGSVPVYYGSPTVRDLMPSDKAVIVATDFKSPKDLADYLKELNKDDNKYNEYLKHRKVGKIINPEFDKALKRQKWGYKHKAHKVNFRYYMFRDFSCVVCNQLHKRNNMLREHLKDSSKPIKPVKMANSSHYGCPMPHAIFNHTKRYDRLKLIIDETKKEAIMLKRLLLANQTNTHNLINT